jgi:hypothetical protein
MSLGRRTAPTVSVTHCTISASVCRQFLCDAMGRREGVRGGEAQLVGVGGEGSAVEAGWLRGSEGAYSGVDSGAGGQNAPPTAPLTRNPTQRPVGGRGNGHPGPQRPAQALWRAIRRPGPTSSVTPAADRVSGLALVLLLQATDVVHQLLDGLPCLGGQAGGFGVNHGVGGLRQELSSLPRYHWSQHDTRCSSRERSWAVAERWGSVSRRLVLV